MLRSRNNLRVLLNSDDALDAGVQSFPFERFKDVAVGARFQTLHDLVVRHLRGDHHHRHLGPALLAADEGHGADRTLVAFRVLVFQADVALVADGGAAGEDRIDVAAAFAGKPSRMACGSFVATLDRRPISDILVYNY